MNFFCIWLFWLFRLCFLPFIAQLVLYKVQAFVADTIIKFVLCYIVVKTKAGGMFFKYSIHSPHNIYTISHVHVTYSTHQLVLDVNDTSYMQTLQKWTQFESWTNTWVRHVYICVWITYLTHVILQVRMTRRNICPRGLSLGRQRWFNSSNVM